MSLNVDRNFMGLTILFVQRELSVDDYNYGVSKVFENLTWYNFTTAYHLGFLA